MRFNDLLRISVRQVLRHRRRYWGVLLAISLGVAGFITVVTMSRDLKKNFNRDMDLIGGVTVIRMYFDNQPDQRPHLFFPATIEAIRALPGVSEVSEVGNIWVFANWGNRRYPLVLLAVDQSFWGVRGLWAQQGRLFDEEAINGRRRECVLGGDLAQRIFGTHEVSGRTLEINHDLYRVIGVVGGVTDGGLANSAIVPITTAQDRIPGVALTNRLYVRCTTCDEVEKVFALLPSTVEAHQSANPLRIEVSWEGVRRVQNVYWWIEFFVYLTITCTLILGGVGIWNVMMAAVRSRTREIGLKKAMGAEDRDILAQFLSEALCLSLGSALVGVVMGFLTVETMGFFIGSRPPEELFFFCLTVGLLFAVALGVGAGLYPSLQASRMEVVSAIRYE